MIMGGLLLEFNRRGRGGATASNGSVAVGGDNSGPIVNINRSLPQSGHSGGHSLTIVAALVEVVGIGVTIWHAYHLMAK